MTKESMTKDQMITRLQALAVILGREADISGSHLDIGQRLAEWEEEAAAEPEGDKNPSSNEEAMASDPEKPSSEQEGRTASNESARILVRLQVTAHLVAWDADSGQPVEFAVAGQRVNVEAAHLAALVERGIAEKV